MSQEPIELYPPQARMGGGGGGDCSIDPDLGKSSFLVVHESSKTQVGR